MLRHAGLHVEEGRGDPTSLCVNVDTKRARQARRRVRTTVIGTVERESRRPEGAAIQQCDTQLVIQLQSPARDGISL